VVEARSSHNFISLLVKHHDTIDSTLACVDYSFTAVSDYGTRKDCGAGVAMKLFQWAIMELTCIAVTATTTVYHYPLFGAKCVSAGIMLFVPVFQMMCLADFTCRWLGMWGMRWLDFY